MPSLTSDSPSGSSSWACHAQPVEHGGRGHGVGRAEHGAEHEGRRPRDPEDGVGDLGDAGDREQDEPDGEQRDRLSTRPAGPATTCDRRRVEQRREEDEEDDVRVELAATAGPGRGR